MRIALFHNLPSGGAKRALYEMVTRLAPRHHIDVFTLSSANHLFADLRPHVASHRVFEFQPWPLLSSPFGRINQAIRLADLLRLRVLHREIGRVIEAGNYDLAFVHPCQVETAPSLLRAIQTIPTVYYCTEPPRLLYEAMPFRSYENGFERRALLNRVDPLPALYRTVLRRTDQHNTRSAGTVLVNSEFTRSTVQHIYGIKAQVSYPGVDTRWFHPRPTEKHRIALSVGSLTPLKGFDFLVQAVASLPMEQRPRLVIASNFQNPPERTYLEQLARDLAVDLQLVGNVSDEALVRLYNEARVVAYSPIREPFGLVPLEAMASGTPVVALRDGGPQETIVDALTGFLTPRDPALFAAALHRLLDDPVLASEMGRNGRQHVLRHWGWKRAVKRLESHLVASLASTRPHPLPLTL